MILADRLGFYDAFIGEHLTEKSENITNSFIFLASLVHATERIKLGTGTSQPFASRIRCWSLRTRRCSTIWRADASSSA